MQNILFIFTDQQRLSACSCYSDTPCQTPNIDRLANEGVRFETAYTSCPVCTPARASIMTGLYPHQHGMTSNTGNLGCSVNELPDSQNLLSRKFESAGYRLGYTGKWHLGTEIRPWKKYEPALPKHFGFEGQNFDGHGDGGHGYEVYKKYLSDNGWSMKLKNNNPEIRRTMRYAVWDNPVESTVEHYLADHTISMLKKFQDSGSPFFLWHNFWGPHAPYFPTQEFYDIYANTEIPEWQNYKFDATNGPCSVKRHPHQDTLNWNDWAEAIRHYYAFMTMTDYEIGRILDYLDCSGLADNTWVFFSVDHGETLGSHGGLTDKGWHHFEEIQRIPLIIRPPKSMQDKFPPAGTVLKDWASLLDFYPTFLDVAGVPAENLPGTSLLSVLSDEKSIEDRDIFVEFFGVNNLAGTMLTCRHENFKYGWNCSQKDELYDLENDPCEIRNLIDDPEYAKIAKDMLGRIDKFMSETRAPMHGMFRQSRLGEYKT